MNRAAEMADIALPRNVEELTAEWLGRALSLKYPGTAVRSFKVDAADWGTASKLFIEIDLERPTGVPARLCVKGEFDERVRETLSGVTVTGTQIEAAVYNELGPGIGLPMLRHHFAGFEPGQGVLVLDDLRHGAARFGSPASAWPLDDVAAGLSVMAKLHGSTWERQFSQFDWLKVGSTAIQQHAGALFSKEHWQQHFCASPSLRLPDSLDDPTRIYSALQALWVLDATGPLCVVHGDPHAGNACFIDGAFYFIDWAGVSYSSWAHDVAYFVTGALSPGDRRAHEVDLLATYLAELAKHGGPSIAVDDALDLFFVHQVYGLIWSTLPQTMQPLKNSEPMTERYTCAVLENSGLQRLRL